MVIHSQHRIHGMHGPRYVGVIAAPGEHTHHLLTHVGLGDLPKAGNERPQVEQAVSHAKA